MVPPCNPGSHGEDCLGDAVLSEKEIRMPAVWVDRVCPLCGSADQSTVFAESNIDLAQLNHFAFASRKRPEYMHPRLIECQHCKLLYGSPVLSPETLAEAYRDAAFDGGDEARYASETYAREIRTILSRLPDRNDALDIGTGDGAFLEQLLGLDFQNVAGVEPSRAPYMQAKPEIRDRIKLGLFRPEDYPDNRFSLVTCFQTMEHISDPLSIARAARSLLKAGGAFVIVVHDRFATSAKILGFRSPIFDVEHLQLFSPRTACDLLERAGYKHVQVSSIRNRYPLQYWMRLFPFPEVMKASIVHLTRVLRVGQIPLSLPAGNLMCAGFK